jgi:hypothetical protein
VSVQSAAFHGFTNPVDPTPAELRSWAYHPDAALLHTLPPDWDLLVSSDRLITTLFDIASDPGCPAHRFGLHCLYIYAADGVRTNFRAHPRRRLRKFVETAEQAGNEMLGIWAHNVRMLLARPELFEYHDWCEGGLVRSPRRIS